MVRDVTAALRGLEFTATEAKRLVESALAVPRAEPWTVDALVGEALRRSG